MNWKWGSAAVAAAAVASTALGQDQTGSLSTFAVSTELRYDDNLGMNDPSQGGSTIFDTRLNFGLLRETRVDRLALDAAGTWRLSDGPDGRESGVVTPRVAFNYKRIALNSEFDARASYEITDLGLLSSDTDPVFVFDPVTGLITIDTGTGQRTTAQASLHFETGIDRPFGLVLDARHIRRTYEDTLDPDLADNRATSGSARLRFEFSPVMTGGLVYDIARSHSFGAVETRRETDAVAATLDYEVNEVTTVGLRLGQRRTSTDRGGVVTEHEGVTARLTVDRELPNGSVGLTFDHAVTGDGPRDTLSVSRSMDLPRGRLFFRLGATRSDGGETDVIGRVDYGLDLKRGELGLALERAVRSSDEGADVLSTRLSANWTQELTALSALQFGLAYARVEDAGGTAVNAADQANLTLSWQRQLTSDWAFTAGYVHRMTEKNTLSAESNAVFVNLSRSFSARQ